MFHVLSDNVSSWPALSVLGSECYPRWHLHAQELCTQTNIKYRSHIMDQYVHVPFLLVYRQLPIGDLTCSLPCNVSTGTQQMIIEVQLLSCYSITVNTCHVLVLQVYGGHLLTVSRLAGTLSQVEALPLVILTMRQRECCAYILPYNHILPVSISISIAFHFQHYYRSCLTTIGRKRPNLNFASCLASEV